MVKLVAIGLAIILGLIVIAPLLVISVLIASGCLAVLLGRRLLLHLSRSDPQQSRIIEAQYKVVVDPLPRAVPSLPERTS